MTDGDVVGQLTDRLVQHGDVVGDRVRHGVARPQHHPERLAGGISKAVDRVEPEPALVVRRRVLLVLRVHLMQRRVDVQHTTVDDPVVAELRRHTCARTSPTASHSPASVAGSS